MNILPLIAGLILVFALSSSSQFSESVFTYWEKTSFVGFMKVERGARNEQERKNFSKAKTQPKPKNLNEPSKKEDIPYTSPREKIKFSDLTRLNLQPLLTLPSASPSYAFLYEATAGLLRLLYKDALFKEQTDLEYLLLDAMLTKAKKSKEKTFANLFPDDEKLRQIFYKMCKGTKNLTGYPSLSDIISFEENDKAVHFTYAPKSLLIALFGEKTTKTIIEEEKKKWQPLHKHEPLNRSEIETILQKNTSQLFPTEILDLMDFNKTGAKEKYFVIIDKDTGVSTRRKA